MTKAAAVRQAARDNRWVGSTRGAAPGQVQCNVVILPGSEAPDFLAWCERNRAVTPILARSVAGDPALPTLGEDIDIRSDLPAYRVFEDGVDRGEVADIKALWQDDWQAFAFGCSFSLEDALRAEGIPLAYEERGFGGAIYVTDVQSEAYGGYGGPLVVSMRPIHRSFTRRAVEVSQAYPQLHGAPVHVGTPETIGIDLSRPLEALGTLSLLPDEEPMFWACGVTTQFAIQNAKPRIAVTHVSSRMLVTDLAIAALARAPLGADA
ncbi:MULTISPECIES: DUF1445 domain-containing protein [unclassified Beijerinckia]|uniref:D-glutamate cyclase family protein n=1 Tax=unclassified Beijerinckia TaxID=2638183 RepID=UPI00089835CE|nr:MULTISPECIES: DUF1445 domain-containing protein [unclassified Beijerinckia]MDH7795178.1 uncharacterized protein YcsI (UPF0317 family) [Beijerinckia sp. GAS462]SEB90761.1 Uncharacterized protein YcsI, UPF0317 family [Beijerinckia sp. 28-YEA-48]